MRIFEKKIGEVMMGEVVAEVLISKSKQYQVGDLGTFNYYTRMKSLQKSSFQDQNKIKSEI